MTLRVVAAGNVRLNTDPWLQRYGGEAIARIGRKGPRPDTISAETAELPRSLIIEIPIRLFHRWWTPEPRSQSVPRLGRCSAIVCVGTRPSRSWQSVVQAQVVVVERHSAAPWARRVHAPECGAVIGYVIEETWFVEVRSYGPQINSPRADLALQSCSVETLPYIWAFADGNKTARTIVQLLPPYIQTCPTITFARAQFYKRLLEVELLLIDRPRSPLPK